MNPFLMLGRLRQTQRAVKQFERSLKVKQRSWRTTLAAYITLVLALALIWAPAEHREKIEATQAAVIAAGLIAARDNKTKATDEQ